MGRRSHRSFSRARRPKNYLAVVSRPVQIAQATVGCQLQETTATRCIDSSRGAYCPSIPHFYLPHVGEADSVDLPAERSPDLNLDLESTMATCYCLRASCTTKPLFEDWIRFFRLQ